MTIAVIVMYALFVTILMISILICGNVDVNVNVMCNVVLNVYSCNGVLDNSSIMFHDPGL